MLNLPLLAYFACACLEYALASWRQLAMVRGCVLMAFVVTFVEILLGLYILQYLLLGPEHANKICYALGGASGLAVATWKGRVTRKGGRDGG